MGPSSPTSEGQSGQQYHHFIPRFVLRPFATVGKPTKRKNHKKNRDLLNIVDFSADKPQLLTSPLSKTFGINDMYKDVREANHYHLEEQLSKLEARAGRTVSKIIKAYKEGAADVTIPRRERDDLRKFLFIMHYRSSHMHQRFFHDNLEGYNADDRERLLRYVAVRGYKSPLELWFDNIQKILELDMDSAGNWIKKIEEQIYPDDAQWFIMHTQMMYLAIGVATESTEFVLTENSFCIFEGPVNHEIGLDGETMEGIYTDYHRFAVISPKVILILRSFLLPLAEEDAHEDVKKTREFFSNLVKGVHGSHNGINSQLADLPVSKARNSYSEIVNGQIQLKEGEDGSFKKEHTFRFPFFSLSPDHVQRINTIMFEQCNTASKLAYKTPSELRRSLEYYLSMPVAHGFKNVVEDSQFECLQKLHQVARLLGSTQRPVFQDSRLPSPMRDWLNGVGTKPTAFEKTHLLLGGSRKTLLKDLDQSSKMCKMRIKIDVWTNGLDEEYRHSVRQKLTNLFLEFPAPRVRLYILRRRVMELSGGPSDLNRFMEEEKDTWTVGPEDVIAKAKPLFKNGNVCRSMYFASLHDIILRKTPGLQHKTEITMDGEGASRLHFLTELLLGQAGSICDCGISAVEDTAKKYREFVRSRPYPPNRFLSEDANIELIVRMLVRPHFVTLLGNKVSDTVARELEAVFFDTLYPALQPY